MKKWTLFVVLTLCLVMIFPSALAEGAAYVPGEITDTLFGEAWNAGKIVAADMKLFFEGNADAFITNESEREDTEAILALISEVFDASTLTLGACKIDGGVRVILSGEYHPEGSEQSAAADIAVNLTLDGISAESSLIEGERITAKWETVLALCGLDDATIAQIMALKDLDFDALITEMAAQLDEILALAGQILTPYADICADFLAGLPIEMNENVPADGNFPAAASELVITYTEKDVRELLDTLASQLEQDVLLSSIIDGIAAEVNAVEDEINFPTASELVTLLHMLAANMTNDTDPYTLYIGLDENQNMLYYSVVSRPMEDGSLIACNVIFNQGLLFEAFLVNAEGTATDGVSLLFRYDENEDEANLEIGLSAYADGTAFAGFQFTESVRPSTTEDGLPAYEVACSMTLAFEEQGQDNGYILLTLQSEMAMTAEGGEQSLASMTMDIYADGEVITAAYDIEDTVTPTEDGPIGHFKETIRLPQIGFDEYGVEMTYYTLPYDAAATDALEEIALETITNEDMNALIAGVSNAAQTKLNDLLSLLPPEFAEIL